jgi:hypothetical protein
MKGGDISNVSSPQCIATATLLIKLVEEESRRFLTKSVEHKIGEIDLLAANKLWLLSNNYSLSLELAGFEEEGWSELLLEKAFEKLERRVVNPFNYFQLYENVDELVGTLPYRPNLKAVIDIPDRVARYGSAGVQIDNI